MNGKIEPGCLAIIVKSRTGKNFGKIVTVERKTVVGELIRMAPEWSILVDKPDFWVVRSPTKNIFSSVNHQGFVWSGYSDVQAYSTDALRPVSGLPEYDMTDTEQPIKETA